MMEKSKFCFSLHSHDPTVRYSTYVVCGDGGDVMLAAPAQLE